MTKRSEALAKIQMINEELAVLLNILSSAINDDIQTAPGVTRPTSHKFGPKAVDHPGISKECPGCHQPLKAGDYTTLVAIGPGSDPESRKKAREGYAYNAVAIEAHWACVTGEE